MGNVGKDISNGLQNNGMMAASNIGLFGADAVQVGPGDFGNGASGSDAPYGGSIEKTLW